MTPRRALEQMLAGPDPIELDRTCLLVAAEECPGLAIEPHLRALDDLAARLRDRLAGDAGPEETVFQLRQVLAVESGFEGNREDYYDPRNSYLNEVLERRTGIPITLSVIYMEVGRRVGLELHGIGFPGHFLVGRGRPGDGGIVLDPFHGGRVLDEEGLRGLLTGSFGERLRFDETMLAPVTPRQLLYRLVNNLKGIYLRRSDFPRALAAVERMLLAVPEATGELRDRGMLLARLGRSFEALRDLTRFRELATEEREVRSLDGLIDQLRAELARRN